MQPCSLSLEKKFHYKTIKAVMQETTFLTCMVFIILVGATSFGLVFRGLGGDVYLKDIIISSNLGMHGFLFLVMTLIFITGFFLLILLKYVLLLCQL